MKKRLVILIVAALLLMALAACKKDEAPAGTVAESVPGAVTIPEGFWETAETTPEETEAAEETGEAAATTEPAQEETEPTSAGQEETEPSSPEQETVKPTEPAANVTGYEWYNNLSGDEQMAFMESFDSIAAFFDWYNAEKAEYERQNPNIEIGDGNIDLGDLIGGNG